VLADARGLKAEDWMVRAIVTYLLDHADRLDDQARRANADSGPAEVPKLTAAAARAKARALVEEAQGALATSPTFADWAASVKARLDGLATESWRPDPREYRVAPIPASGKPEDDSSSAPPGPEAEDDTRRPDSSSAEAEAAAPGASIDAAESGATTRQEESR